MEILGDRKFIEVPGTKTHELPPLLVRMRPPNQGRLDDIMEMANRIIDLEDMGELLDDLLSEVDRRKRDVARSLVDEYRKFLLAWELPVSRYFSADRSNDRSDESVRGHSIEVLSSITDEEIARIRKSPRLLYNLDPRKFEELIARVFEKFGYRVELTTQSRDGGRDVVAITKIPARTKVLIECKRYSEENKVGINVVQRLLGVVAGESATAGIVATTSTFTRPATEFLTSPMVENRVSGKDFDGIKEWLSDSGTPRE